MTTTAPKITATEIDSQTYAKGNQFTETGRLLVEFGHADHKGKPLVEFNTFIGFNATMRPESVAELAAMFAWAAERAECPEFAGACIALSAKR